MSKMERFRIVNKTNKTVTVKIGPKVVTSSWDEFNKVFIIVDKFWAIFNEEEKKRQEKADDIISDICICFMLQRGNADPARKMGALGLLGAKFEELQKLLGCTNAEAIQVVQSRLRLLNPFMVDPIFNDERFSHKPDFDEEPQDEYESECDEYEPNGVHPNDYVSDKPTFGDAFSCLGDLKKKLENE